MSRLSAITTATERMLLSASIVVVLAIHFGGWVAPGWFHSYVPFAEEVWQLLPAAQIVLLAVWLVGGIARLWLRMVTWPVLLCIWASAWGDSFSSHTAATWLLLTGAIAAGTMLGARCCGVTLAWLRGAAEFPRSFAEYRHPQFSLLGLLLLTTLVGLSLGVLEMLRPALRAPTDISGELELILWARAESGTLAEFLAGASTRSVVLASSLAAASLAAIVCVLRPGTIWLRLLLTGVLAPALGFYLANLTGDGLATGVSLAISLSASAGIAGISVWPLRLLGVRMICRTGFHPVLKRLLPDRLNSDLAENSDEPRAAAA